MILFIYESLLDPRRAYLANYLALNQLSTLKTVERGHRKWREDC